MRFLIVMILGICVLLLFITGRTEQTAMVEKLTNINFVDESMMEKYK